MAGMHKRMDIRTFCSGRIRIVSVVLQKSNIICGYSAWPFFISRVDSGVSDRRFALFFLINMEAHWDNPFYKLLAQNVYVSYTYVDQDTILTSDGKRQ